MLLRPVAYLVVLGVRETPPIEAHDPHDHGRLMQILLEQRRLAGRVTPPAHNLGRRQPTPQHRQVIRCHGPERIGHTSRLDLRRIMALPPVARAAGTMSGRIWSTSWAKIDPPTVPPGQQ